MSFRRTTKEEEIIKRMAKQLQTESKPSPRSVNSPIKKEKPRFFNKKIQDEKKIYIL